MLKKEELALWRQMNDAWMADDKERYEELKRLWFLNVDRQMANIEAHESKEHIDKMWNNNKDKIKELTNNG